jgi:hypothetical protein
MQEDNCHVIYCMQKLGTNKAILEPLETKDVEKEEIYIFTGEGVKPAAAIRAKSLKEAEEKYKKITNSI